MEKIIHTYLVKYFKGYLFDFTWIPTHGWELNIGYHVTDNHKYNSPW